jgi:DNA-binding CsgD family transcriptional regulator
MPSGRIAKQVDMEAALDLLMRGESVPSIACELGISPPTLRARIADLQAKQGVLLQYRAIQSLQLTELQARVLEAITPEKINDAPLRDLVMSYKILKDKEQVIEGKPSEIRGLVAHLIHLEKQEVALANSPSPPSGFEQGSVVDIEESVEGDGMGEDGGFAPSNSLFTSLSELDQDRF